MNIIQGALWVVLLRWFRKQHLKGIKCDSFPSLNTKPLVDDFKSGIILGGPRSGPCVVPPIGGQNTGGLDQSRCSTDAGTEAHTLSVTLADRMFCFL